MLVLCFCLQVGEFLWSEAVSLAVLAPLPPPAACLCLPGLPSAFPIFLFFLGWDNPPAPVLQFLALSPCSCALLRDLFFSLRHQKEEEQQGSHCAQSTKGAVPALPLHSS